MEDSFGDHMVFKGNGRRINHDQKSIKGGTRNITERDQVKFIVAQPLNPPPPLPTLVLYSFQKETASFASTAGRPH